VSQGHHERPARALAALAILAMAALMAWLVRTPVGDERIDWRAIAPPIETPMHDWRWIVVHHSGWRQGDTASIDSAHVRDRGWEGIGYHFVIGNGHPMPRGRVDATWRWKQQYHGAHAGSGQQQSPYNQDGIGICVIGNYDEETLDPYVETRLIELCALLIAHDPSLSPAHIIGHRDVPGKETECPGKHIDIARVRFLVREELMKQEQRK
jgi:N-acetyl-anhydromuramyl-L-alanine amidase AmpD